ncbi:hypothetical protein [Agromyces silvae]|uniref:hypothetical protein n=1 Tax=Agromyces silvae TaxID=3388266 RepID=UPI00280BF3A9|nr:hypothetical protein [Agromyces protaetiae]
MIRLVSAMALLLGMTATFAGCALRDLRPAAPTEVQPVFASDEEALDAAVSTYERYLVLEAEIVAAGGAGAERVLEVATDTYGLDLLAGFREMRQTGERLIAPASLTASRLVEIDSHRTRLSVAMCLDIRGTPAEDLRTAAPADAEDLVAVEVAFRSANAARILLDGSKPWSGGPVC